MTQILVSPRTESEAVFIIELLNKLNMKSKRLSSTEIEDYGMVSLLKESDRSKKVSKEEIMRKLQNAD